MARQFLAPGLGYLNADGGGKEYLIPGIGYFNDETSGVTNYTLTASAGAFTLTGNSATLILNEITTSDRLINGITYLEKGITILKGLTTELDEGTYRDQYNKVTR